MALGRRLKVPTACGDLARLTARYAPTVRRARELKPASLLDLLLATDALRRPERLQAVVRASALMQGSHDTPGVTAGLEARLTAALAMVRGVDAGGLAREGSRAELPRRIRAARLRALRVSMRTPAT
jgi:tRNA nucleotidyltransferase (CCA-adding enzyme)